MTLISEPREPADPSDDDREWVVPADAWPDGFDESRLDEWDHAPEPEHRFQYPIGLP